MSFWTGSSKIHELYTAACGLYVCWLSIRGVTVLLAWMPQGRTVIVHKVQEWTLMVGAAGYFFLSSPAPSSGKYPGAFLTSASRSRLLLLVQILKTLVVALLVAGVIPLLLGLLFELVIVAPLRVPLDQTPLFYPWQVLPVSLLSRSPSPLEPVLSRHCSVVSLFLLACRTGLWECSTPKSSPLSR